MKKLTSIILILFLSLLSSKVFSEELTKLTFKEGSNKYQSEAIAFALNDEIAYTLEIYLQETHFAYGANNSLSFNLDFDTASYDLNRDGSQEVFVTLKGSNICGSGGCTTYILEKDIKGWKVIGRFFPGGEAKISSNKNGGYFDIYYFGRSETYLCSYIENSREYDYDCGY